MSDPAPSIDRSTLKKGDYCPVQHGDLRGPCPILNSFANHGLISRDGRNIYRRDLHDAIRHLGFGLDVTAILTNIAFKIHADHPTDSSQAERGLRDAGDVDSAGQPILRLDRVGRPNAIEHDVSVTRQDRALGDCIALQPALLDELVGAATASQGAAFTVTDFGHLRKRRYDEQRAQNAELKFDKTNHTLACGEIAAISAIFGRGLTYHVPTNYVQALFGEERLPYDEGWQPRWTPCTLPEVFVILEIISSAAWPF